MHSRTSRWLPIAVVVAAALGATGMVLLLTYAIAQADGLLIAFTIIAIALLLVGATAAVVVVRSLRARGRERASRLRALEHRAATAPDQTAMARLEERLGHAEASAAPMHELQDLVKQASDLEVAIERLESGLAATNQTLADRARAGERLEEAAEAHRTTIEELEAGVARLQRRVRELESAKDLATLAARVKKMESRWAASPSPKTLSRAAAVVDGFVSLAEQQGRALTDVVTRDLAAYRIAAAAHGEEALVAIPYLDAFPDVVGELTNAEVRGLLRALRRAGYMHRAVPLIEELARRMGKPADVEMARVMASELALFTGKLDREDSLPPLTGALRPEVVLHLVGKALPATQSGYTLRTHYTVEAQRRVGIRPLVVAHSGSSADSPSETQHYEHGEVPYVLLGGPQRGRVPWDEWLSANVRALAAVVREARPAVLHAHSDFVNALIALPVARAYGIPLVNETRGFWEESWLSRTAATEGWDDLAEVEQRWGLPDMYRLRVEREAYGRSQSDAVVTLARVMEQHIREVGQRLELPVPTVSIAPNAVDASSFAAPTPDAMLRASLGLRPESLVVGYISSIVEYEGIDTLVRGVHALRVAQATESADPDSESLSAAASELRGRDVQLLIVGDGPELESLRALATSLGVDDIVFTGRVPHERVQDYYALIDLFVVPRKRAAVTELVTPLKPFEAMAAGLPCLFSDVAALAEIAQDSGAAELFRADDPDDLALRLTQLLGDEERRRHMGEQGARWVRRERTWDANATTYLELYRSLGLEVTSREAVGE